MKKYIFFILCLLLLIPTTVHGSKSWTLTDEYYQNGQLIRLFVDSNGRHKLSSINIDSYLREKIEQSDNKRLEAKKQLMKAYLLLDLEERLKELNYKTVHRHNVTKIDIHPSIKNAIENEIYESIQYGKHALSISDQTSIDRQYDKNSYYYVDYPSLAKQTISPTGEMIEKPAKKPFQEDFEKSNHSTFFIFLIVGFILILSVTAFYFKKKRR